MRTASAKPEQPAIQQSLRRRPYSGQRHEGELAGGVCLTERIHVGHVSLAVWRSWPSMACSDLVGEFPKLQCSKVAVPCLSLSASFMIREFILRLALWIQASLACPVLCTHSLQCDLSFAEEGCIVASCEVLPRLGALKVGLRLRLMEICVSRFFRNWPRLRHGS